MKHKLYITLDSDMNSDEVIEVIKKLMYDGNGFENVGLIPWADPYADHKILLEEHTIKVHSNG